MRGQNNSAFQLCDLISSPQQARIVGEEQFKKIHTPVVTFDIFKVALN